MANMDGIQDFLSETNKVKGVPVLINRWALPGKASIEYCEKVFIELTEGRYVNYSQDELQDEVLDMIPDFYGIITGVGGRVEINYTNLMIVHRVMMNKHDEREKVLKGVLYHFAAKEIEAEFRKLKLKIEVGSDRIRNKVIADYKNYGWAGCKLYFYSCFMSWIENKGFRQYYYEKHLQNLIASTMFFHGKKVGYSEAERMVFDRKDSFFIEGLDKEFENRIAPYVLTGNIKCMNGAYTDAFDKADRVLRSKEGYAERNMYSLFVRGFLMKLMGQFCVEFRKDRDIRVNDMDMCINYISPTRIGIKVKNDLDVEGVLPTIHPILKRQERFNIDKFVLGDYFNYEV